jgi:hypothetical protein
MTANLKSTTKKSLSTTVEPISERTTGAGLSSYQTAPLVSTMLPWEGKHMRVIKSNG